MNGSRKYGRGKGAGIGAVHGYRPRVEAVTVERVSGAWAVRLFWAAVIVSTLLALAVGALGQA